MKFRFERVYFLLPVGLLLADGKTEAAIAFWAREAFGSRIIREALAATRVLNCSLIGTLLLSLFMVLPALREA